MKTAIDNVAYFFDTLKISRRIGFYFTLWITWYGITESIHLAEKAGADMDTAAIIAAIMVPVSGLQGAVLSFHHKHKDESA